MSSPVTPGGAKFTPERRYHLRSVNLKAKKIRPSEEDLSNLDASLKKNSAYIKKLRNVSVENYESLATEFFTLKLTKYVGEAATSLLENRLKNSNDILSVVEIASLFHQRYADFTLEFLKNLEAELSAPTPESLLEDKPGWLSRQRQLLRLISESCLCGIIQNPSNVYKALLHLLPEDDLNGPLFLPLAISFVKGVGGYFLSLNIKEDNPISSQFISPEWQCKFNDAFTNYFKIMSRLLVRIHTRLRTLETKGRYHYENRGDLSTTQTIQLQETSENFEKFRANLQNLAELLQLSLPELGSEVERLQLMEGKIVFSDPNLAMRQRLESASESQIFDNEEERSLYEDIMDLRERVSGAILPARSPAAPESSSPMALEEEFAALDDLSQVVNVDPESLVNKPIDETLSIEDFDSAAMIKTFYEKLSSIQSRALADQSAIDFCYINSKTTRRRLADTLINLPYRRLDLLPFIGRLLATLKPYFPEVITFVNDSLVGQFIFLFYRKEPILGTRSRICRYIGELTKFGVMPQTTTFAMLKKVILDDLAGYNIEMVSVLLESCGRFLYNQPVSHKRILNLFEIINKKKMQGMELGQIISLENAMYVANPPNRPIIIKREKSPRLKYLFNLIRSELDVGTAKAVFRKLRRFPWLEEDCRDDLMRALLKVWKIKFACIPLVSSMLGSLKDVYPSFVIDLVDRVLEEIRYCLELNQLRYNHRMMTLVKFAGELFCYTVIEADIIFALLHQLVSLGHKGLPRVTQPCSIDSPDNHFRIRLICILLQTCTPLIPVNLPHLDSFLTLFEYYIATKTKLPIDLDFFLRDTFEEMDRKFPAISLRESILRLIKASNESLSFLLEDLELRPESIFEEVNDDGLPEFSGGMMMATTSQSPGDEQFDKALNGMMVTSLKERRLEGRTAGTFDAPLPLSLISPRSSEHVNTNSKSKEGVSIKMLIKKRNKAVTRELLVDPSKVSFVHSSLAGRERKIAEAEEIRQLVLESQRENVDNDDNDGFAFALSRRRQQFPRNRSFTTFSVYGHRQINS